MRFKRAGEYFIVSRCAGRIKMRTIQTQRQKIPFAGVRK